MIGWGLQQAGLREETDVPDIEGAATKLVEDLVETTSPAEIDLIDRKLKVLENLKK